ncbi:MAG TPA: kelch repeat-containing protein [Planctomycetota bacterium]|mgnify:CR=1 FL=1|nr:kelch repeat-containing protein [Planctomycetota bacterium]HRR80217.1 kelch repeat-containing protein [Planctomycetota bacterium]HRT93135.1 kelch repeat-containing protein [Planctomycetota bacterium]
MRRVLCILATLTIAAAAETPNAWMKLPAAASDCRPGSVLLAAPDLKQMLLVVAGEKDAPQVRAFDPAAGTWSDLAPAPKQKGGFFPYYQAAYDPGTKSIYCLSGGPVLHAFRVEEKTWTAHPPAPELEGLSWHALACDPAGKRLVVVGSDKKADNLGWLRTVVYDIPAGRWTKMDVMDEQVEREHRELVAAKEAVIDLRGRIRLAWFRDPKGVGTEAELKALAERCDALKKMPQMAAFAAEVDGVAAHLGQQKTLDALTAARALQSKLEAAAEAQYPIPCSRRNSPLVYDPTSRLLVLFGGDHEDYLMNDTWLLDLEKKAWRRAKPDKAPSPRAGHALVALPKCGKIALYEGYIQSSSTDYGAAPYAPLAPRQLWLFDPKAERWDLAASWPLPAKDDAATPAPLGIFDGYSSDRFCPPALAADANDRLILAAHAITLWFWRWKRPAETWALAVDPTRLDAEGREKLGTQPDQRLYRTGPFVASFCEVPDEPKPPALDQLPDNQWVRLPDPPRNPCHGCRQRDWGTCVWDSDRDQILMWGGGHCVRSSSVVAHWSPASGRIVEGYDADEPYGGNGGGGFDSSLLNRPWVSAHNYNHYAYDPKCKLLVSGRGYLYDPERMDWLRIEPYALPFAFSWGSTVVETSPHGAVAWARKRNSDDAGLWLFDREKGWTDLAPKGKLFAPYCDAHGMVYDSKRDRMILSGVGGGYAKLSSGDLLAFDFKTKELTSITPGNSEFSKTNNARELAYIEHADWVLIGELYPRGEKVKGTRYTRVYDCARNRMFLLDAGPVPDGYAVGWMYDAARKLAYAFTYRGEAWAMKVNPATARLLERAEP